MSFGEAHPAGVGNAFRKSACRVASWCRHRVLLHCFVTTLLTASQHQTSKFKIYLKLATSNDDHKENGYNIVCSLLEQFTPVLPTSNLNMCRVGVEFDHAAPHPITIQRHDAMTPYLDMQKARARTKR
ncbi:hypothetical protein E2C01_091510 [Portunus trituberculatus]|uniref:Uncharacterized protein n=1 Tax=Portunus trituberculatus TaxID=210409 RepID=A0A5B7JE45_PORTR|nr:hypothetical protein [Portunus trituberculatus]